MDLQLRFTETCRPFTDKTALIDNLWSEIEKKYSEKGRHYHNLQHLEDLFAELDTVKDRIRDYTVVSFSVFYHDVIYDATSKSNEEKSAAFAVSRLEKLCADQDSIRKVSGHILATKSHQPSDDTDTCYLLDADLSILGKDAGTYTDYTHKIRKEYAVYPDFLYRPGRKKVLQHFLASESVFKTEEFRRNYEVQARENLRAESELL